MSEFIKQSDGSYVLASDISDRVIDDSLEFTIPVSGGVTPPPPVTCEDFITEETCTGVGCYWYDDSCHGKPQEGVWFPSWYWIIVGGGIIVAIAAAYLATRK